MCVKDQLDVVRQWHRVSQCHIEFLLAYRFFVHNKSCFIRRTVIDGLIDNTLALRQCFIYNIFALAKSIKTPSQIDVNVLYLMKNKFKKFYWNLLKSNIYFIEK